MVTGVMETGPITPCDHCGTPLRGEHQGIPWEAVAESCAHSHNRCRHLLRDAVKTLRAALAKATDDLSTARHAAKWVVNHGDRNNPHDIEHAKLALEGIIACLATLRAGDKTVMETSSRMEDRSMDNNDPKTAAQLVLVALAAKCPIGVYSHRKGGEYVVHSHSIDEATLAPLVHYFSREKGTRWTRTIANFVEQVDGRSRFERVRDATSLELHVARSDLR